MSFKFELEQWQLACEAFDKQDYDTALKIFIASMTMGDASKIHFNIGSLFTVLNDHKRAVRYKNSIFNKKSAQGNKKITAFNRTIANDTYFAVAHFQRGVSLFLLGDLEAARDDFDKTYQLLHGNELINYQQLGLHFTLYSCQVLFNRGICQLYLGNSDLGLEDLHHAQACTQIKQHGVIDQAIGARGKGYSVYSMLPGLLFRPSKFIVQQMKDLDWFDDNPHWPSSSNRNSVIIIKRLGNGVSIIHPSSNNINQSNNNERQWLATNKLKIKCHFTDTRILLVPGSITLEDLKRQIGEKYNVPEMIRLFYKTEEGHKRVIKDKNDLLFARTVYKSRKKDDSVEKLEIWVHF